MEEEEDGGSWLPPPRQNLCDHDVLLLAHAGTVGLATSPRRTAPKNKTRTKAVAAAAKSLCSGSASPSPPLAYMMTTAQLAAAPPLEYHWLSGHCQPPASQLPTNPTMYWELSAELQSPHIITSSSSSYQQQLQLLTHQHSFPSLASLNHNHTFIIDKLEHTDLWQRSQGRTGQDRKEDAWAPCMTDSPQLSTRLQATSAKSLYTPQHNNWVWLAQPTLTTWLHANESAAKQPNHSNGGQWESLVMLGPRFVRRVFGFHRVPVGSVDKAVICCCCCNVYLGVFVW